ncbi:MAG: DUF4263 domain-containing protein [Salinibacterium sp.]|nr:DUF4263 domain-containing protein [Salinibacterium sp.]
MARLDDEGIQRLKAWAHNAVQDPNIQRVQTVLLKNGPQVYKTASLFFIGPAEDEIRHRKLVVRTSKLTGGEFVESKRWNCDDAEVDDLLGFLDSDIIDAGTYDFVRSGSEAAKLIRLIKEGDLTSGFMASIAQAIADRVVKVSDLSEIEGVELVSMAVDLRKQNMVRDTFEAAVLAPGTKEQVFQDLLDRNWWLLGANYVARVDRRQLVILDEHDLVLIRADGVAHIIELKRADIARLVHEEHSHFTVGHDINKAVNQSANYLRALDEQRAQILTEFDVDCRRAQATVIIGHPKHCTSAPPDKVREAIRTYNSHLSRIEVITYEDVLQTATNSITALQRQVADDATHVELGAEKVARPGQ